MVSRSQTLRCGALRLTYPLRCLYVEQYAVMAEVLGRGGHIASEIVNCSAPDTGNMGKYCSVRGG